MPHNESMIKRAVGGILARLGYELRRTPGPAAGQQSFALYTYLRDDGSFDYQRYRQIQEKGNRDKIDRVWAREENIAFLCNYLQRVMGRPEFGICHGTKRGKEQQWFRKYLNCEVIGTEISETAERFPHTIRWDFHEAREEWIDSTDFIYSNSFDHSYDPERCLNTWMSCVRKGGLCIIEHSSWHTPSHASELDPFGVGLVEMPYLITRWGKGRYGVREILEAPERPEAVDCLHFLIIQRF